MKLKGPLAPSQAEGVVRGFYVKALLVSLWNLREGLCFSSNSCASDSLLIDNKAAALLMLTKSVRLVKDAHEEMEQVREATP